ncbi:MAG TPA: MEDS domain-containing protein, partial [Povalibacter sp.]|nr:MEDS domain-containing protein [Povalibacter sp.]
MNQSGHLVQFFDNDREHIDAVAAFVQERIECGCTCIVVARPAIRSGVAARLETLGQDVTALAARYQYIELDGHDALAGFVEHGRCNRLKFHQMFDTLLRQAGSRGEPVCVYGEMGNLLMAQGLVAGAIECEELGNELCREHNLT